MVTAVRSVGAFTGWEFFLAGVLLCLLAAALAFFSFRCNRNRAAAATFLLVLFAALEACDTVWSFYFFPGGEYVDRGAAWAMSVFLLTLPALSALACAVCTWFNKKSRGKVYRMKFRDND